MTDRRANIVEIVKQNGRVSVEELAEHYDVSVQTIRKDLNELEKKRLIRRVHGGAVPASGIENLEYQARRLMAGEEKARIAARTAELIENGSSLFINIGTTTEACAEALINHKDLLVITNNMNVANLLRPCPEIEVMIIGGFVRHSDGAIIGETAIDFINQFRVDCAIIGISAIEENGELMDYDLREVKVAQAIMNNARNVILVSDSSKFTRKAPVRLGHISQINSFVTDHCPSENFNNICANHGVKLIETFARKEHT